MMPIQLRAAWDPSRTEALFSEGSSGEYDASARKRRSAETHSTNPTSSFNRRFLPGSKIFEKNVIWQATTPAGQDSPDNVVTWPELDNYDKKPEAATMGEKAMGGELGSGGTASRVVSVATLQENAWDRANSTAFIDLPDLAT